MGTLSNGGAGPGGPLGPFGTQPPAAAKGWGHIKYTFSRTVPTRMKRTQKVLEATARDLRRAKG